MSAERPTVSAKAGRGDDRIDPRSRAAAARSHAGCRSELGLATRAKRPGPCTRVAKR